MELKTIILFITLNLINNYYGCIQKILKQSIPGIKIHDINPLTSKINEYFHHINKAFKEQKSIAIVTRNQKVFFHLLKNKNSFYKNLKILDQVQYKDNIRLFYCNGNNYPHNKPQLIYQSENKMNFLKILNLEVYKEITGYFTNQWIKIGKFVFNLIEFTDNNPNKEILKLYKNSLGFSSIDLNLTFGEKALITEIFNKEFYEYYDDLVINLNKYLWILQVCYNQIDNQDLFHQLKQNILIAMKKSIDAYRQLTINIHESGSKVVSSIFNSHKNHISLEHKKQLINYTFINQIFIIMYMTLY